MSGSLTMALVGGFAVIMAVVVAIATIKSLIIIVPPNVAAVVTGKKRQLPDGSDVGYRTVIGGRTLRIPIIESVAYMSLESMPIEISVTNAFSKGNIPLNIEAIANVKIASQPATRFHNAVERLLGKGEKEIRDMARDTLMGNLRGVLATMTPEEVNEDRLAFAKALSEDAGEDLAALGFHLDVLKIQNVSDEKGYLAAIGRKATAIAVKDAEVAEANALAETTEAQAESERRQEVAQANSVAEQRKAKAEADRDAEVTEANAQVQIAEAKNTLRVRKAQLDQEAETTEKTAKVAAEKAEVEAQKELQERRVETTKIRLQADVVEPAQADREAAIAKAEAEAAPIRAAGEAQAQALTKIYEAVKNGGEDAVTVMFADKLPEMLRIAVEAVRDTDIDRLVVLDGGSGGGVANAQNQKLVSAMGMIETIANAMGVDIPTLMARVMAGRPGAAARKEESAA